MILIINVLTIWYCNLLHTDGWLHPNEGSFVLAISLKMSKDRRNMQEDTQYNNYKAGDVCIMYHWGVHSCNHCCSWKSNEYFIFCVCVCCFMYPACNAHEPYCHLWLAPFCNFFPHYIINGTIKKKKLLNMKCVFWVLYNFCLKNSHSKKKWVRCVHNCILVFM